MDPINITNSGRNIERPSSPRLLERGAFPLSVNTVSYQYWVPDGDGYAPAEESYQWNEDQNPLSNVVRVRGARKQRAARAYTPKESIKVVPIVTAVEAIVAITVFDAWKNEKHTRDVKEEIAERELRMLTEEVDRLNKENKR